MTFESLAPLHPAAQVTVVFMGGLFLITLLLVVFAVIRNIRKLD